MYSAEPLPHFVGDYLSYLHETQPTSATFDGVHAYDDLLDDLTRVALEARASELGGFRRRLDAIGRGGLTPVERLEQRMLAQHIRGRIHDLEEVRAWELNPQRYADTLATSLAGQVVFDYAPAEERARRVLSKLRQTSRLIEAARQNIKDPPGIFVKIGAKSFEGTLDFIEKDLPKAFASLDDLHVLGDLADASNEAAAAVRGYLDYLRNDLAPKSRGSFRLGRERFEQKLRFDEGITLGADGLLVIAMRELRETQEEFRRVAGRLGDGDASEAWHRVKARHPTDAELIPVVTDQLQELATFVERNAIVSIPAGEPVVVAPTLQFHRWTFASMWTPGPFEAKPIRAHYYITGIDPAWSAERQEEHLRDFNYGALWAISMHETFPGHFLHYQHLRQIESKLRKSIFFCAPSFVEGWAHYCEQMMLENGFGRGDDHIKLGQLAEALIRLARLVVGIKLHAEDFSVEQSVRFFRNEAFMEEGSARREAERGTFDPGYVVYSAGRLMLLKLRADYEAQQQGSYSLRTFHDTLLANGAVPFWMHRRLMLREDAGDALE